MKIEIISREQIKPSSPTPPHLQNFKLSFIDQIIPHSYIPIILYYSFNKHNNINQTEISHRLKDSLSNTLLIFYPLAGRFKDQSSVNCCDAGILYIEANASCDISHIIRSNELSYLDKLIPYKSNGSISSAEELLAIQVNLFTCGGFAIGICISHRIADGFTLTSFIKCWAGMSFGDCNNVAWLVFDSAFVFPPRNTPDFKPNLRSLSVLPPVSKLVAKRFVFASSTIEALKMEAMENSSISKPTRVEVISAFLWKCLILAKGIEKSGISVLFHPVNLRERIPDLLEKSFGNLFQMVSAENVGEANLNHLVEKLRNAFMKIDREYIEKLVWGKDFELAKENFMEISKMLALENIEVFRFSSYCRFPIYEADFGWGKPVWVSSASFSIKDSVLLFDCIESPGGIEAWIVMDCKDMEKLEKDTRLH